MYHFISPRSNGSVFHVALGGSSIEEAFESFSRDWWEPKLGAVGVWHNQALCWRILPIMNQQTGELEPFYQELKP